MRASSLADGARADHAAVAGLKDQGALTTAVGQRLTAVRDLPEIQLVGIETPAPFEVVHVIVNGFYAAKSEMSAKSNRGRVSHAL